MTHTKHRRLILIITIMILSVLSITNSVYADDSQKEPTDKTNIDSSSVSLNNGNHININLGYSDESKYQNIDYNLKVHFDKNQEYTIDGTSWRSIKITNADNEIIYDHTYDNPHYAKIITSKNAGTYTISFYNKTWNIISGTSSINIYKVLSKQTELSGNTLYEKSWYVNDKSIAYSINPETSKNLKIQSSFENSKTNSQNPYEQQFNINTRIEGINTNLFPNFTKTSLIQSSQNHNDVIVPKTTDGSKIADFYKVSYTPTTYEYPSDSTTKITSSYSQYKPITKSENTNTAKHLSVIERLSSLFGDPVDTATGGFQDNRTLLSYSGNNPLKFNLSYDSVATENGLIPGGYATNYETSISKTDSGVRVYWNKNSVSDFTKNSDGSYTATDGRQKTTIVTKTENGYTVDSKTGGKYYFNSDGQIDKQIDLNHIQYDYTYNENNQLTKVSNSKSQTLTFTYDTFNRLSSVYDKTGRTVIFEYTNGKVSTITMPDKTVYSISYNTNDLINKIVYANTTLVQNTYDDFGRVTTQYDGNNNKTTFAYADWLNDNQITTTIDNGQYKQTVVHDRKGNLIQSTNGKNITTSYTYDKNNLKTSETDGNSHKTTFTYNDAGLMTSETSPLGKNYQFKYDDNNNLSEMITPDSKSVYTKYSDNKIIKSVDKAGNTTTYDYDEFGNNTTIIKNNKKIINTYDDSGYLIKTDSNGTIINYKNDALGRPISTKLSDGTTTEIKYDTNGNILSSTSNGKTTTYTYDAFGAKLSSTTPENKKTSYTYDNNGNQLSIKVGNQTITNKYDSVNRLTETDKNNSVKAKYSYDNADQVVQHIDSNNKTRKTEYDNVGNITKTTADNVTSSYQYNADDEKVKTISGNGNVTTTDYNNLGQVSKITKPNNSTISYTYDDLGNAIEQNNNGQITKNTYDADSNLTSSTDSENNQTKFEYNSQDELTKTTNALGYISINSHNDLGQVIKTYNNRGEVVYGYTYDSHGNIVKTIDGNGNTQNYTYDSQNNLLTVTDGEGNTVTDNEYDEAEQLTSATKALNQKTTYSYSNNTVSVTSPLGHKSTAEYNPDGQITKYTDSTETTYENYTATGKPAAISYQGDFTKTNYTYDADDNLINEKNNASSDNYSYTSTDKTSSWLNGNNVTTNYSYDSNDNLTNVKSNDTDDTFAYNSLNQLVRSQNNNATTTNSYDSVGHIVKQETTSGSILYNYDDRGFLTDITYPSDHKIHYNFDVMGRITDVTDWNNHKTTYDYDKNNRIVKTTHWNGSTENRTYDKSEQLINISTKNGDTTIDSHDYTYDAEGNLTKDNNQSYSYDSLNRLTSGLSTYQYSITGNIEKSNNHSYTYGNDNRLSSVDNKSTSVDSAGNLTSHTENNKTHTATYNSQNELTKYDNSSYTYDANGNRISQNDVKYTHDTSGNLISDSNHDYIYGPNGLIGYYQNDKFYTNVYNNRGDVTKILDESGDVVSSISYGDYGNITSKTGDIDTPFSYAGQGGAVTDNNGLVYLKTRYYNPELMRFMNRDTVSGSITEPQSLNRYTYVQGNPLTYIDLTGQSRTFVTVGNVLWFGAGFLPIAGSLTAAIDLVNDLSQAPVDNTTMLLDLTGVGAGLFGGRGVEAGTADIVKDTKPFWFKINFATQETPDFAGIPVYNFDDVHSNNNYLRMFSSKNEKATDAISKKKPYSNPKRRPKYAKGQVEAVWEKAMNESPDGIVRDPHTQEELSWDKSKSRANQWDMGHTFGNEYTKLHKRYMDGRIDKNEFLETYRNPDNYIPEDIHANRSHKYEDK